MKLRLDSQDLRGLPRAVDHVRRKVDADRTMSSLREDKCKKARARAEIQHAKRPLIRQVPAEFRRVARVFFIFKLADALLLEALRAV